MKTNSIAENLNEYIINGKRKADDLLEICLMNTDKFVSSPEFVTVGQVLHYMVKRQQYGSIMPILSTLRLPEGYKLHMKECSIEGIGDKSELFVKVVLSRKKYEPFEILSIEDSYLGAFQTYLLKTLWHSLPLFWHANYARRTYIFSNLDFQYIETDKHNKMLISEISGIMSDDYIKPIVGKFHDSYYVSCCYWTNFGGLIRDYCKIRIENNQLAEFSQATTDVLYKYDCGICY